MVFMNIETVSKFIVGFDLAGKRDEDGKLHSYVNKNVVIDDFPKEITFDNITYTIEYVKKGEEGYETAIYV